MRILVHDYGGYAFAVQLSRELAARGHQVLHAYCESVVTPHRLLSTSSGMLDTLAIRPIGLPKPLDKYSLIDRWGLEREYGRRLVAEMRAFGPEVVLSANTPLDAQKRLVRDCRREGRRCIFWLQDLLGLGSFLVLRGRMAGVGWAIGRHYVRLESRLLRKSDAVVAITDDFRPIVERAGVDPRDIHTIENWAPLEALPAEPKDNPWSRKLGLHDKFVFLYSGTLGMKHNPALLLELAVLGQRSLGAHIVVVSQGYGADWLAREREQRELSNLHLLPYQPFEDLPQVLGSADVLVGILEPEAGIYSVPSKVLTYHCAGRPLLLAVPPDNLASRLVTRARSGLTVPPGDVEGFLAAARKLADGSLSTADLAANARRYAETTFDIGRITDRFERILAAG